MSLWDFTTKEYSFHTHPGKLQLAINDPKRGGKRASWKHGGVTWDNGHSYKGVSRGDSPVNKLWNEEGMGRPYGARRKGDYFSALRQRPKERKRRGGEKK